MRSVLSSTPVTISHFKRNLFLHSHHFLATHFFLRLSLSLFCWLTCFLSVTFFDGLAAIISNIPSFLDACLCWLPTGSADNFFGNSRICCVLLADRSECIISNVRTRVWQVHVEVCASFRRQNVNIVDKFSVQSRSRCSRKNCLHNLISASYTTPAIWHSVIVKTFPPSTCNKLRHLDNLSDSV